MCLDFIPNNENENISRIEELSRIKEDLSDRLVNKFKNNLRTFITSVSRIKKERKRIAELTLFIDDIFKPTKKVPVVPMSYRVYCILNDIFSKEDLPVCEMCGKIKAFKSLIEGFYLTCGSKDCFQKHPETNRKRQETAIKNYGSLKAAYHDTMSVSVKKKYNADNVSKLDWVKEKKKETSRKRYGTDYPWQSDKGKKEQKDGVITKYNVKNVSQLDEVKKKKVETNLKNWNVDNPSKHPEIRRRILQKNGKIYITPSGRTILYEGDENFTLDYLYKTYNEKNIWVQPEISIPYIGSNGKNHIWLPDIRLIKNNVQSLIELKGINLLVSFESNILNKINGAIRNGFESYVILYHKKELYELQLINYDQNEWELKSINGNSYDEVKNILENGEINFNII